MSRGECPFKVDVCVFFKSNRKGVIKFYACMCSLANGSRNFKLKVARTRIYYKYLDQPYT